MTGWKVVPSLSCALLFAVAASCASAQNGASRFQQGEWLIHSTVTTSSGQSFSSTQRVCAHDEAGLSKHPHPGQQCDPPAVSSVPGGLHVHLSCHGASGPAEWKMVSDVTQTFSKDNKSFTSHGTTTTVTQVSGNAINAKAAIEAHGTFEGPCSAASAKP